MTRSVFGTDALYRLLVEQVEDYAIFALDTEGHVRTWTPSAERLQGYTADEIIGRDFSAFYPPDAQAEGKPHRLLRQALEQGHIADEGWRVRKGGARFWAGVVLTALRDDNGVHVGFAKITHDLSTRREAEEQRRALAEEQAAHQASQAFAEELEQANEQLQSTLVDAEEARDALAAAERFSRGILESISDPFIVIDADWKYRFLNAPAAEMIGAAPASPPDRVIGESMWELTPDVVGAVFATKTREAMRTRTPIAFEAYYPRRGEWALVHCYPLPDGGLAIQWRDVTEHKRTEEANHYLSRASIILNRSLDYEATLGDLAQLVVPKLADWCTVDIADEDGRLRRVAVAHVDREKVRVAEQLDREYPPEPSETTGVYGVLHSGKPELYAELTDEMLASGARDAEELRILRALGLTSVILVPLATGKTVHGVLTLVSAESGRRYGEADLELAMELAHRAALAVQNARLLGATREAQRAAEEANRAKSEFLATMSHELRTPLNAIGGYVELLRLGIQGPITPQQDDYLERIERSEKYLLSLIQDVLNFAKIEAGRVDLRLGCVDAIRLLRDVGDLVAPQLDEVGLRFEREPCPEHVDVHADPDRTQQILLNLLTNAIKFTSPGGVVHLSCDANEHLVRMRVRDTGSGIPRDKLESIFEPFVQLDRSDRGGRAGTGLGLAISRDLAYAMQGDLTVESEVGRGSTFTLTLPRFNGSR